MTPPFRRRSSLTYSALTYFALTYFALKYSSILLFYTFPA